MENSEGKDPQEKERIHLLSEEVTILRRLRSELPDKIRRLEIDRNALLQVVREKDEVIREKDARIAELERQHTDAEPSTFRYISKDGEKAAKKARGATR